MKRMVSILLLLVLLYRISFGKEPANAASSPNVILILADDLGYGDLSCYGQTKFHTPNIDALAAEGLRFTQHYAGAPVCAPSRSALLMAKHTGHTTIRGNKKENKNGDFPLSKDDTILPQLFKAKGYSTGIFGKWGLGYPGSSGDVNQKGFEVFFGYYGHLAAHNYYPEKLWYNNTPVSIPANKHYKQVVYAPSVIQDSVMSFLQQNKANPFFLYLATTIPHAELTAPLATVSKYKNTFGEEKPYKGIKTMKFATRYGAYDAQESPKAAYAAMIEILDKQV
jgi:arylsulfatase A-like enzyme